MFALASALPSLTASWKPLPSAERAWLEKFPTSSPPRSGATAAADADGTTWLFGGYAEPENKPRAVVNDLLRLDPDSGAEWQRLQEPLDVNIGDSGRVRTNRAGPRLASASAILGDEMLVFGGWDPQEAGTGGVILDDVWALDLKKHTWSRCAEPMPRGPTSRPPTSASSRTATTRRRPSSSPRTRCRILGMQCTLTNRRARAPRCSRRVRWRLRRCARARRISLLCALLRRTPWQQHCE